MKVWRAKNIFKGILHKTFWNFVLAKVRFPTSKTKLDIQYNKRWIQVVLQNEQQFKIQDLKKLGNIRKISNLGRTQSSAQSFFQDIDFGKSMKLYVKTDTKVFQSCPTFPDCSTCSKNFVQDLLSKEIFGHKSAKSCPNLHSLTYSMTAKLFSCLIKTL